MRVVAAFLVGAALGFGGAWLAFEWPFGSGGLSAGDVEFELLKRERSAGRQADDATCEERRATGGRQYLCEVRYGDDPLVGVRKFLATVHGESVSFKQRPSFTLG